VALVKVAAIIVTRGDQNPTLRERVMPSLPEEWQVLVWDNGKQALYEGRDEGRYWNVPDVSVYGRYAAIEYTDAELIYVQDDDCVVSDPQAIVDAWHAHGRYPVERNPSWDSIDHVVCNMPSEFRHEFYEDHALVGFGACFHRDAPARAFEWFFGISYRDEHDAWFHRCCDIVFTGLTPRVLVEVPHENLPYALHYDRMYRQAEHQVERARMREMMLEVRDA
jgi:hypothetical protein